MKLSVAILLGACIGVLVHEILPPWGQMKRPNSDFLTAALGRAFKTHVLSRQYPWLLSYIQRIEPLLREAPLPPGVDLATFLASHVLLPLVVLLIVGGILGVTGWICIPMAITSSVLPYYWLKNRCAKVHTQLLKTLPDCLDLLALVMQAGLDLGAAIQHYLDSGTPGPLKEIFATCHKETQMGYSRVDALRRSMERTSFLPLRDTLRGIAQALVLGTSLSPMFREQANLLRVKRMQIAEKKAAEAPLKMLFPLLIFIFPTVFIILMGPILIMFMKGGFL